MPAIVEARVVHLAMSPPPAGRSRWTTRLLAKEVRLTSGCVSDLLRRNGLKPHLIRTYKVSRDPAFVAKVQDVVGLYLHPPEHAVADHERRAQRDEEIQRRHLFVEGRRLGNANFRHFRFQGGVGTCKLDFGGELEHEVDVDVQVGMGVMTILVPQNVGARVFYEKNWISRVDCAADFSSVGESEYISDNYNSAQGKMNTASTSNITNSRAKT